MALMAFLIPHGSAEPQIPFTGTWSAPSLSQPSTPIIVVIQPDGKATEQVGSFHGTGTWKVQNGIAQITWDSGWIGHLRIKADGFELLTWKNDTPPNAPPDDVQPAHRVNVISK